MNRTQLNSPTPEDEGNSSWLSEIVPVAPEVPCRPFKRIPKDRHSTVTRSHRTPSKCTSTTQRTVLRGSHLLRGGLNFTVTFTCKDLDVSEASEIRSCYLIKTDKFFARQCQRLSYCTEMQLVCKSHNTHQFQTEFRISHCSRTATHQPWSNLKSKLHSFE